MPAKMFTDGNYAFMPSSNDALYSPTHKDVHSAPTIFHANGYFHRDSSAVASPNLSASAHTDGLPGTPSIPSSMLSPQREQVSTASSLPVSRSNSVKRTASAPAAARPPIPAAPPADEQHWHILYSKLQTHVEDERQLWKLERQTLNNEILALKRELAALRSSAADPVLSDASAVSAKENQYFNQDVVAQAQEKLRQLSQVSPHSSRESSVVAARDRENSASARLPSITEERPGEEPKSVLFVASTEIPSVAVTDQAEDPHSPPTTAKPGLSPPPENFRLHAGHTPRAARSNRESFHDDHKKKLEAINEAALNDPVDDPPLKGPLVLAPSPQQNPTMLADLDKRLQSLADSEDDAAPECLRGSVGGETASGHAQAASASQAVVDGGIRLKVKRSMNFGAPLGDR